jgi:hypothetical protein
MELACASVTVTSICGRAAIKRKDCAPFRKFAVKSVRNRKNGRLFTDEISVRDKSAAVYLRPSDQSDRYRYRGIVA